MAYCCVNDKEVRERRQRKGGGRERERKGG
jgi:hypothetical protein